MKKPLKMSAIPHFDQMSISQMIKFFTDNNWEFTEKADGSNVTFGVLNDEIFVKTKKGSPVTDPQVLIEMDREFNSDIHRGFAEMLQMLQSNDDLFVDWYNDIKSKHTNGNDFQIFGELFSRSTINVIEYSDAMIGRGALYLFMVKYTDSNTKAEVDISDHDTGRDIMQSFKETFNEIDGWKIYNKQAVRVNLKRSELVDRLVDIIDNEREILQSRAHKHRAEKQRITSEVEYILKQLKTDALSQIKKIKSILGADEIEGVVVRNLSSGSLAKIVDLSDFGDRRLEQWSGVDGLKQIRRKLLNDIQNVVLKNADIFVLPKKQIEKLSDALQTQSRRYYTIEEMMAILYADAISERPQIEQELDELTKTFEEILKTYLTEMKDFIELPEIAGKFKAYTQAKQRLRAEQQSVAEITKKLKAAKSSIDKYIEIIQFFIGSKGLADLRDKFLRAG